MSKTLWGELVTTADGSLSVHHATIGESFHSALGALAEARCLYLEGSGLSGRLWRTSDEAAAPIRVLDVGLGLGCNALTTLDSWMTSVSGSELMLMSLESDGRLVESLATGTAPWAETWPPGWSDWARCLEPRGPERWLATFRHPASGQSAEWWVCVGDAAERPVPIAWDRHWFGWEYIWQDPFSPTKNPSMWTRRWFHNLAASCAPGAILMTYSVAKTVRSAVADGGWQWERIPTPGPKRHWLRAWLPRARAVDHTP